jgi:hypothetical protein
MPLGPRKAGQSVDLPSGFTDDWGARVADSIGGPMTVEPTAGAADEVAADGRDVVAGCGGSAQLQISKVSVAGRVDRI